MMGKIYRGKENAMSDKPNRRKGEKTYGQMGLAVTNTERRKARETLRNAKKNRIARNRALKKADDYVAQPTDWMS